ncbi:hypothetical protein BO78DRAFT_419966 [Aspergillus sclerotiicarbonarius CBS 121057]|uniref:C2H2 type zinc finger domain protein n=1 Tax=Aspergillus sclerotiicarbonarius (strain CBS 121057 / IBT 28362) TaxID=1448318 RepID=A0A319EF27_ASPSB|nr:hypothetical protein BO78DRAFT_419966 [Aspergillus sclerotiicarbonarius CBS 121057]
MAGSQAGTPPNSARSKGGKDSDAEYWCDRCKRSFERSDHYARHVHSHEDLRPYRCPICPKGFNRGDLLYRHKQTHLRKEGGSRTARATRACQACVQSKSKCTDQKPCQRCVSRGEPCLPSTKDAKNVSRWSHDSEVVPTPNFPASHSSEINDGSLGISSPPPTVDPPHSLEQHPVMLDEVTTFQAAALNPELAVGCLSSPYTHGFSFTDAFFLPTATGELDGGCFELDLDTLQALMQPVPNDIQPSVPKEMSGPAHASPASSRFEFFRQSPWLWTPVHVDNAYAGQDSLRVNEKAVDSMLRRSQPDSFTGKFTPTVVDSSCRDRILFMIYSTPHSTVPLQAFPSESYLDRMVQVYFGWQSLELASWIHAPSFSVTECHTELLATVIGAGASSISIDSVCRMGYALQERSRLSLSASIEKDNSRVRDLQTIQAYLLWVSVSLWSGFKRNMEVAETFLSAPVTMLRRYGCFSRTLYAQSIFPRPEDDVNTTEAKWRAWAKQESLKRTAIFAVLTDLRCSMAYLKPPNCSVTELSCPLPLARDIWLAPSAASWKDTILSYGMTLDTCPSWLAIAQNPSVLDTLPIYYDKPLIALVAMHGFWSQAWAYQESQRFFRASGQLSVQATTTLWLSCQHEDLAKRIGVAQHALSNQGSDPFHVQIVAEFCLMALNVSPRELQQFAGRLGAEEAATTHHLLRQWMVGPEFKTAVWHAGQILRIARTAPAAQLREFSAVVVYQASLTLWAYVPLLLRHFFMFGKGNPGISVGPDRVFCPLTDIRAIMTAACDVYRDNFNPETETFPPLLESMMNLMIDLGNIDTASF